MQLSQEVKFPIVDGWIMCGNLPLEMEQQLEMTAKTLYIEEQGEESDRRTACVGS